MSEGRDTELVSELRRWALFESARSAAVLTSAADALESTSRALREKEGECERLRKERDHWKYGHDASERQRDEALAALKASEEREAGLRGALEPMAAVASDIPDYWDDTHQCVTACGHFRRARSVLENSPADLADATKKDPGTEQREAGV